MKGTRIIILLVAFAAVWAAFQSQVWHQAQLHLQKIGRKDCVVTEVIAHAHGWKFLDPFTLTSSGTRGDACYYDRRILYKNNCHLPIERVVEIEHAKAEKADREFLIGKEGCPAEPPLL